MVKRHSFGLASLVDAAATPAWQKLANRRLQFLSQVPTRRNIWRRNLARVEFLEPRHLLAGDPIITEFMAKNDGYLEDGDGNAPDWIEIQNVGDALIDLAGYRLTDTPSDLSRWVFPSVRLDPGQYLVVFASGQDADNYVDAGDHLHTNFALSAGGEYLALVTPDGTILSQYGTGETEYPPQIVNTSYGAAQRQLLLDGESDASYWQPLGADVDGLWTQIGFDAASHGFAPGQAAMGYENEPDSRSNFSGQFLTDLPANPHAIYSRIEFNVEDASVVTRLLMQLKYDNGFVAYLNETRVAEANAPANPQWFSPAQERVPRDAQALEFVQFDLTEHVPHLVDGTNVLAIHALNHLSDRDDMLLVPELTASINNPNAKVGYISSPTPGSENVGAESIFSGFLGDTSINGEPGFYDEPLTVTVNTETPDAEIRYTTDGSAPTATIGTVYSGPIQIDTTTNLRAAAFKEGHLPSNVATQSYLFLEDVIRQSQEQPGLPTEWLWTGDGNHYAADYEMDQRIVDDPAYRDEIVDSLKSIRTMSIVMDPDDLFGPEGMHNNTEVHGRESEHPMSLEILNPDGSLAKQVDAGIRLHGAWTRHYDYTMKMSFRLSFRSEYGATNLEYPLFPDSLASEFDNIVLHSGRNRDDAQLVSNSFGRDTNRAMGNLDAHATYVHLYLNGLYWGLYNPFERIDAQFAERYLGGVDTDYDAIAGEGSAVATDGTLDRFNTMMNSLGGLDTKEKYKDFLKQVDLDILIDFILVNQYMAHREHEYRAIGKREGDADIRFMIWDVDEESMQVNGRTPIETYFTPSTFYRDLTRHPEISLRYADRMYKHLFNDGVLTPESAIQRWESRASTTRPAVIAESARWGDMLWEGSIPRTIYTLEDYDDFAESMERFFPSRTDNLFRQLATIYPDVGAPLWNQFGGPVPADFQLAMTHPNTTGIILYTLDGTDPRLYGGEVSTGAIIHDGSPVIISDDTVVKARVLSDGEWSALAESDFFIVGPDSPFHLRVTEVNYHPHETNPVPGMSEANVDNSQFEFVEITNASTAPVDLSGVQLMHGFSFTFPGGMALDAGKHTVVVKNREAFESRYGTGLNIAGQFEGALADSRRSFELRDASGRRIQEISYDTLDDWPQRANGLGSSLEIINPFSARVASDWRASNQFGGSPGVAHLDSDDVVITEVLAHQQSQRVDRVELHNTSSAQVDVSHWYISKSDEDYFQQQISPGTTIASGGFHVMDQTDFGFDLSGSRGDQLWLIAADAAGKPMRFTDYIQFGPSGESVSLGPAPDGTWLPLAEQTFGRANTGSLAGDVIISEVHYAPLDPDGDRRLLKADNFEFIELYNRTDSSLDVSHWQVSGGAEFTLPAGTVIEARQSLLLVPFDPAGPADAPIFRITYGVDSSVPMLGPYAPVLSDDGGVIRVQRPDVPPAEDPTFTPYLYVDEITYEVTAPWPTTTVDTGLSLTRVSAESFGNFPSSWTAQSASPGSIDFALRLTGDANGDGLFNQLDLVEVLQGGKYQTGQPASFREGDWNEDGIFDQLDLVAALQTGNYLGALAASGSVKTAGEADDVLAEYVDQVLARLDA